MGDCGWLFLGSGLNEETMDLGFMFTDEQLMLWDRDIGFQLKWLFKNLIKFKLFNAFANVEVVKSPALFKIDINAKSGQRSKYFQRPSGTSSWVLVVLHNHYHVDQYKRLDRNHKANWAITRLDGSRHVVRQSPVTKRSGKFSKVLNGEVRVALHVRLGPSDLDSASCFARFYYDRIAPYGPRSLDAVSSLSSSSSLPIRPSDSIVLSEFLCTSENLMQKSAIGCQRCLAGSGMMCDEACPNYCLSGECMVRMADFTEKKVSELLPGDLVLGVELSEWPLNEAAWGLPSGCAIRLVVDEIEAVVCTELRYPIQVVELHNGVVLTPGHPVLRETLQSPGEGGLWVRPRQCLSPSLRFLPAIYNFVLRKRQGLLVRGPQEQGALDSAVVCSTLGQFASGVDKTNSSFFGSEQVVSHLKLNPRWPMLTCLGPLA